MFELNHTINAKEVLSWLDRMLKRYPLHLKVVVGYEADYALAVHENIEMAGKGKPRRSGHGLYWDPQGKAQAKFLEDPARRYKKDIATNIRRVTKATKSLKAGMLSGSYVLKIASQELVPVEYGDLKASAFNRVEEEIR